MVRQQKAAFQFVGKAGEAHRVFVLSADTFGREGSEPWKQSPDTNELEVCVEFMARQTGPADVLLSFDGRNVAARKSLAKDMEATRHVCELWITFAATKRLGRRVAWSADCREMGWISLPVARTAVAIKERGNATSAWGETTHDTVYSGVVPVPWDGLPMMSREDKARVMNKRVVGASTPDDEVPIPSRKVFDTDRGLPLYWAERKPVEFWEYILWSLDAHVVVDLSPGSASVGRACLRAGIQYVALCRNEAHASWVGNIMDRESCELIVKNPSPLFEQDLASMVKKHFEDVLEQLQEQGNVQEKEPDLEHTE